MVENTNSTTLKVQVSFGLTYMVGFIPLNFRSQEMDKGVPRARRRRRPGVARRGEARHADSWRDSARADRLLAWLGDLSPSASLCERLNRGAPLSLGTREKHFQSHSPAASGRCLRSRCRSRPCTGDRQLGFWGASTRLPKTSPTWQKKLAKDLDHQSA